MVTPSYLQLLNDRLIFRGRRICFFCSFFSSFCHRAYGCVSIEIILLHAELWLLLTEFEELMLKDVIIKYCFLVFCSKTSCLFVVLYEIY